MPDAPAVPMSDEARDAVWLLDRLAAELRDRQPLIARRLAYYRGEHPLVYASEEFRGYMADRFAGFSDNWTSPVVQGPAERMNVLGVRLDATSRQTDAEMARVWRANDADRGSSEAFVVMMAAGRSFGLVWGNPDDEDTPIITWERPDQAVVAYDPATRQRTAGLKLWRDDEFEHATLYTPEKVWKFSRRAVVELARGEPKPPVQPDHGWEPRQPEEDDTWPVPNPMGAVPLVELRNQTLLDDAPLSDIDGVIAMQDAINLVWAYLMNALDFASLPQRVILGTDIPKVPILGSTGQIVGYRPVELDELLKERILWVPGSGAQATSWPAANLEVFSRVIERAIEHIAAQTRTPPHYLIGRVANLSAEALVSAETGLVSKTGERIVYATPEIREMHRLVALAQDDPGRARAVRDGIVAWADPQFRALGQKVDALVKLRQVGFPLRWIAEQYGLEPAEVDRVMQMITEEADSDPLGTLTRAMSQTPEQGQVEPPAEPVEMDGQA